jgi:hypothetical protein
MSYGDEQWTDVTGQMPPSDRAALAARPGDEITTGEAEASATGDDEDRQASAHRRAFGLIRFALRSGPGDLADADEPADPAPGRTPADSPRPAAARAATGLLPGLARPLLVATAAFAVSGIATALWYPGSAPSPAAATAAVGTAQPVPTVGTTPTGDSQPPVSPAATATAAAAAVAAAPGSGQTTFSAVTGPSCQTSATASFNPVGYWTESGLTGWLSHSGGLASAGCSGTFLAMPMSGDSATSGGNGGSWLFTPGPSAGTCTASVYIPAVSDPIYNGGASAYYSVSDALTGGHTLGSATVDQAADAGKWVPLGQYPAPASGVIQIQLSDRGVDWTASGPDYAHFSVDAAQLTCKA